MTGEIELVKRFPRNTNGRDFVVGDIHGHFDKLDELLLAARFDEENDRLFAVGDLIDRGPDSERVVEWLAQPWFHSTMGNHEAMLVAACIAPTREAGQQNAQMHANNGGEWFYALEDDEQIREIFTSVVELPLAIEIETATGLVGLLHADVPGNTWVGMKASIKSNPKSREVLLWGRERLRRRITTEVLGVEAVYVGHSSVRYPIRLGNVQYMDTGCGFPGRPLTMIEVATGELFQVE